MFNVQNITSLQHNAVRTWHDETTVPFAPVSAASDFPTLVLEQHRYNYELWHEEDIARSPDVGDKEIARVKRSIDRLNQLRNDWIEKLDAAVMEQLAESDVLLLPNARLNTETPGSAVDRLSIMSLRIYHLKEQQQRADATAEHRRTVAERLECCLIQHHDLSQSLSELLDDLFAGRKILKIYRQFKMYNDPAMNPYLYNRKKIA